MNIYPPLLLAPGSPYLAAGKIFPAPRPRGPPSSPGQARGTGRPPGGRVLGSRRAAPLLLGVRPRTASDRCPGYSVAVSACTGVCVTKRVCARALRTFPDFSLGRRDFLPLPFSASPSFLLLLLHLLHPLPTPSPPPAAARSAAGYCTAGEGSPGGFPVSRERGCILGPKPPQRPRGHGPPPLPTSS